MFFSKNQTFRKVMSKILVVTFYSGITLVNDCDLFLSFLPLVQLSLRDNDLISLPKDIGDLGQLKELHIQGNRLTVLPPELGTDP